MGKGLEQILTQKKSVIAKYWFDLTAQTYAPDTAEFIKNNKDQFANPVGGAMLNSLNGLLDQLINRMDPEPSPHIWMLLSGFGPFKILPPPKPSLLFCL